MSIVTVLFVLFALLVLGFCHDARPRNAGAARCQ
jgi:hypothetical protein